MSGSSKNGWNDENQQSHILGHILEQMSSQLGPNDGSSFYQTLGFVPAAATSPWPSHDQPPPFSPSHPNTLPMDPSLTAAALGNQVGYSSLRSYSVNQEPYPDMEGNRTPLLRSSSDLGIRLNHFSPHATEYSDRPLENYVDQEPLDGSVFFASNSSLPLPTSPPFQNIPPSADNEIMVNQLMHYHSYAPEPKAPPVKEEQSNYFTSKLSNFTASLGTWLSPLDQSRANYSNNNVDLDDSSGNRRPNIHENLPSGIQPPLRESTHSSAIPSPCDSPRETKPPIVTKPSYSDVLSKALGQESKPFSNTTISSKAANYQSNSSTIKSRTESSHKSSTNKGKHRNSAAPGRNRSPNTLTTTTTNNVDPNYNSKYSVKTESTCCNSKVGLDDFDLPENMNNCNSSYGGNLNNNNISKAYPTETFEKLKKRPPHSLDEYSPCHQAKKGNKNDPRRLSGKVDESPSSSDVERVQCDKLNNHTLSTQQKQTPKRTTYINNNLAATSPSVNTFKSNNAEISNILLNRRGGSVKDDTKFQYTSSSSSSAHSNNKASSNSGCNLGAGGNCSPPASSTTNASSNSNPTRTTVSGSRSSRNVSIKCDRSKEAQSKKNTYKRRKEASPYSHSELVMTAWTMCLLWIGILTRACLWLFSLVVDVIQMSYRLTIHFSLTSWEKVKLYYREVGALFKGYWLKISSFISRKKEAGKKGRYNRKSPSDLESNISLPTTGEDAMKRLLACRGKDPYSILGVTRDCTDDDIKKYYKRQAFLVHPDKNKQPGAEEAFKILAHAFEIIGEPERREQYDKKVAEEAHLEGATGELASLLNLLKEKLEEAANTIRCTNCSKRHRRVKLPRPVYAARHCSQCHLRHAAREGDIWAEKFFFGIKWKYFACMESAIYDISDWAYCQRDNLRHISANTHSVQYRIVSGKKNSAGRNTAPECPTDPELEEFFNNLCREKFGQDFVPGPSQCGGQQPTSLDMRKRRGKKKK